MTAKSTLSSIVIRSYQPSDLSACQEIFSTVHRSYGNPMPFFDAILQTDMSDIEKNYLEIPNGHWWVAVSTDDNRVVGHIAVLPLHLGDPAYYRELPERERDQICELLRLAVVSDVQRKGVGSKLLSTLIAFAREKGYCQIHLTTLASMNLACAFYEKNGFIKGRIEKDSVDSVLLDKCSDERKPVIFEANAIIPDEDLRLMKMSPSQSKLTYSRHYFLRL